jgi:hypothetical protein
LREEPLTKHEIGRIGELIFEEKARSLGFDVWFSRVDRGTDAILTINGTFTRVQVKSVSGGKEKNAHWQTPGASGMPARDGVSFVACVNIADRSVHVVPLSAIPADTSSISETRVKKYKDAFHLIASNGNQVEDTSICTTSAAIKITVEALSRRGIVCHVSHGSALPYHMIVDVNGKLLRIKVSTATKRGYGRFSTNCKGSLDFDFLLSVEKSGGTFFVLPASGFRFNKRRYIYLPKDCPSKNAFHLLTGSGTDAPRTNDN